MSTSGSENSEKSILINTNTKINSLPMDLAPKIALVKPTDNKGITVQTQQTFR